MGGSYSASSSASAANEISSGPVTFGGVAFGNQTAAGSNTTLYIGLGIAAIVAGWFMFKK